MTEPKYDIERAIELVERTIHFCEIERNELANSEKLAIAQAFLAYYKENEALKVELGKPSTNDDFLFVCEKLKAAEEKLRRQEGLLKEALFELREAYDGMVDSGACENLANRIAEFLELVKAKA